MSPPHRTSRRGLALHSHPLDEEAHCYARQRQVEWLARVVRCPTSPAAGSGRRRPGSHGPSWMPSARHVSVRPRTQEREAVEQSIHQARGRAGGRRIGGWHRRCSARAGRAQADRACSPSSSASGCVPPPPSALTHRSLPHGGPSGKSPRQDALLPSPERRRRAVGVGSDALSVVHEAPVGVPVLCRRRRGRSSHEPGVRRACLHHHNLPVEMLHHQCRGLRYATPAQGLG